MLKHDVSVFLAGIDVELRGMALWKFAVRIVYKLISHRMNEPG